MHVTLLRHGDLIVVDLAETGTLIPRSEVRVDDAFLRDLASEVEVVATRRGAGTQQTQAQALARTGGLVFSHLLTEPVRRRLRDAPEGALYLRLDERLVHVPWELCHDGEQFLFERFRVGRQVITTQAIPDRPPPRAEKDRLRVLVIADPAEDLPQAALEGERLCTLLDAVAGVDVTLLAGRSVRRIPLLAALQEHDAVHFAGHSHFDAANPSQSGWRLADGILTAGELARLWPPPLLVFSNSCEAATSAAWQGGAAYEGHAYGIGSAFLMAGVANYVGTFWVVHDEESVTFATTYYRTLAGGACLGEALAAARLAVIATHGPAGLTWASYLLYGDPAARPLALGARPVMRRTVVEPSAQEPVRYTVSLPWGGNGAASIDRVGDARRLVGRDAEIERLAASFSGVLRTAERSAVFVSGPPGIGKTSLLDAWLARVIADDQAWVAQGQAVEHYGAGEAYLPLLGALGRLGRTSAGAALVGHLRRHAPTWLAQLPALIEPSEHEALARRTLGSTRDRMLRELADVLEALTAERALVLVLEDLHWSDHATIEAIAYVAQCRSGARLLVVGTYRPAEVLAGDHPLRAVTQDLEARRRSEEIRLDLLGEGDVERYLHVRFGVDVVARDLVRMLYRRTEGHPLFLVNVVDFALREELIATVDGRLELRGDDDALSASIPGGLLPMIERQIEALSPEEQQVLEAAAVAGAEFSSAAVVAALDLAAERVEERCEDLAWRGQFLRANGMEEWPDGTLAGRYRFVHALYQNVLYQRVAEPRRVRLHRRIGERKAAAFGADTAEIAAELASHFEAARDPRRALGHRVRAGDLAVQRHAEREAVEHYRGALRLMARLDDRALDGCELDVLVKLATRLMSTAGYAAPELEKVFDRAYALSRQLASGPHLAPLLRGLVSFHHVRCRLDTGSAIGEELLALCARGADDVALVQAHYGHGVMLYDMGEIDAALPHLEAALLRYQPETHLIHVATYGGYDPGVACRSWFGWLLWVRGEPDRAVAMVEDGLTLAEQLGHPFSLGFACVATAVVHLHRGDVVRATEPLERACAIASEDGFPYLRATAESVTAWAELLRGNPDAAIARGEAALAEHRATGANISVPAYLLILGYAYAFAGHLERGLAVVTGGLEVAMQSGQWLHVGGLWRARGELLGNGGDAASRAEAEECHRRSLELARKLRAPMLELQAANGYARFLLANERRNEARPLLAPAFAGFSEGFDTAVLRDAKSLLDAC